MNRMSQPLSQKDLDRRVEEARAQKADALGREISERTRQERERDEMLARWNAAMAEAEPLLSHVLSKLADEGNPFLYEISEDQSNCPVYRLCSPVLVGEKYPNVIRVANDARGNPSYSVNGAWVLMDDMKTSPHKDALHSLTLEQLMDVMCRFVGRRLASRKANEAAGKHHSMDLVVGEEDLELVQNCLQNHGESDKVHRGPNNVIRDWECVFPDGCRLVVQVVAPVLEDDTAWAQGVLYDPNGVELTSTEVLDSIQDRQITIALPPDSYTVRIRARASEQTPEEIVEEIANKFGLELVGEYGGRTMYGSTCYGIVCPDLSHDVLLEALSRGVLRGQVDKLGTGHIVYWPNVGRKNPEQ